MNAAAEVLLGDVEALLDRAVGQISCTDFIDVALLVWLLGADSTNCSLNEILTATKTSVQGAGRTYRDIAALGYLHTSGLHDSESLLAFDAGLSWLCGCSAFIDNVPVGFATDAVALLGISLGVAAFTDTAKIEKTIDWLVSFSDRICEFPGVDEFQRALISAAHVVLGSQKLPVFSISRDCADVRIALLAKDIHLQSKFDDDLFDTLDSAMSQSPNVSNHQRILFQLSAIRWVRRASPRIVPNQATIEQVTSILHSLPFGLRRWTWEKKPKTRGGTARKWHLDHEYHFQNMLWLILAPIFPDLTYEEFTPIIGGYQPRSDIAIPSMKLIVEAKYWRGGTSSKDMIEQVSADCGLYFVEGSRYSHLLPVIWDEARRSEEHHLLRTGLKKLERVIDAVIIGKPSSMND